jgi:hypothetical protein
MQKLLLTSVCTLFLLTVLPAQEKLNIKFGKIQPQDFDINSPLLDSNVNAIVLSDQGSTEFEGNSKGWFSMIYRRHKRIKLINKNGFDAADISIVLYSDGQDAEKLSVLKANTYNLENGNVVTTELGKKSIFVEKINRNLIETKFTFPALTSGSIIEYTYTIESDFMFNLQPWIFQGQYPCIWSEYNVKIPDFFNYVFLSQGYLKFDAEEKSESFKRFIVSKSNGTGPTETFSLNSKIYDRKWVIKNIPSIKEEIFTTTLNNHIAKIEFQLSEYRFPDQPIKRIMGDWKTVTEKLLEREDFGLSYTKSNGWLDDDLKTIIGKTKDKREKAEKIFEYVRNNFTCTKTRGIYVEDKTTLKDVFNKKSGTVSDINLLLITMLKKAEIQCEPVILSLRNRGTVHPIYPLMDRFNYLIAMAIIDEKPIYLDASKNKIGFNQLPAACYNGTAWVIEKDNTRPIELNPDSIMEYKTTSIFIMNNAQGEWEGSYRTQLGKFESISAREDGSTTKKEGLTKELVKKFGSAYKLNNLDVDTLNNFNDPVKYSIEFTTKHEEDILYINPLFGEETTKNPFTSKKRLYPIEMPFINKEIIILDMEIPKGYVIEEMPKSVRYFLNENEGLFEYLAIIKENKVQLRSIIHIKKANFPEEDYETLREFFAFVIQKQGEQIVFKKSR